MMVFLFGFLLPFRRLTNFGTTGWEPHKARSLWQMDSMPQASHLENGIIKLTCFIGLLGVLSDIIM